MLYLCFHGYVCNVYVLLCSCFVMFLVVMFMFNYVSMIIERWIRKE